MQIIFSISHNLASISSLQNKIRLKKLVKGLNDEYFRVIEVHEDTTYEKVFNRALELEARIKTRKREREM